MKVVLGILKTLGYGMEWNSYPFYTLKLYTFIVILLYYYIITSSLSITTFDLLCLSYINTIIRSVVLGRVPLLGISALGELYSDVLSWC